MPLRILKQSIGGVGAPHRLTLGGRRSKALMRSFETVANNLPMLSRLAPARRSLPAMLGVLTLASVIMLLAWDADPRMFPPKAHGVLGALPLALIAFAYLLYQAVRRPSRTEAVKAILLAVAFLFWSANQLWPDAREATLFNDIAIALFVLDVFLVIIGWPGTSPDESFAETCVVSEQGQSRSRG
jgi:hypothetical protein